MTCDKTTDTPMTHTTSRPRKGSLQIPTGFTGEIHVWGFDCVPDVYQAIDGRIVKTLFSSCGDWTKVG